MTYRGPSQWPDLLCSPYASTPSLVTNLTNSRRQPVEAAHLWLPRQFANTSNSTTGRSRRLSRAWRRRIEANSLPTKRWSRHSRSGQAVRVKWFREVRTNLNTEPEYISQETLQLSAGSLLRSNRSC